MTTTKWILILASAGGLAALTIVCCLLGLGAINYGDVIKVTMTAEAGPPALPEPLPTAPPSLQWSEILPDRGDMTDLQWSEYRRSLTGRRIEQWTGQVNDVQETMAGGRYYVEVRIDRHFDDVFLYLDRETALALEKGQRITFSGQVSGTSARLIRNGFALEVENVTLH